MIIASMQYMKLMMFIKLTSMKNRDLIILLSAIIAIGLLLIFTSCERLEYDVPVTYTVPEGQHYSNFPTIIEGREIWCAVWFTESCRYDPQPPGESGWNKLIGLSATYDPHDNSCRWAWRYDHNSKMIRLAGYAYIGGDQNIQDLFGGRLDPDSLKNPLLVPFNEWIDLSVKYDRQLEAWQYWRYNGGHTGGWMRAGKLKGKNFWWYGLYFGGNAVAPHDISVIYKFSK